MKTNNIIYWVLGIILFAGVAAFVWMGDGGNDTSKASIYSASALSVIEGDFDFGTIPLEGGAVTHNFEIKNDGEEPVKIKKIYTSCMCTTANVTDASGEKYGEFGMPGHASSETNIEVEAGESVVLEAIFDPSVHGPAGVGLNQRLIYVETTSQKSPKLELFFQATVVR